MALFMIRNQFRQAIHVHKLRVGLGLRRKVPVFSYALYAVYA
jgi:hypothetical protein